ncbi:MAG TPA: iron-sulfur cluster assembly scaffold protein, partial [Campylobacterales bacterium]|nr:iron-sulfur cluster assembly scaffold protein [Campylobacterales bacterium]
MAKDDLIGGSIWEQYSKKVSDRMNNPLNRGEITEEEAADMGCKLIVADYGAESCGDAVRLYWAVDPYDNIIKKSQFKSFGCGTAIASSDMMAELCVGKTVDEAVKITNLDVEFALRDHPDEPAVPPQKMHCSVMAYDVIKKAASIYKGVDMESFEEEVIVCECARVSLRTIKEVIKLNNLKTVEEITAYTKA